MIASPSLPDKQAESLRHSSRGQTRQRSPSESHQEIFCPVRAVQSLTHRPLCTLPFGRVNRLSPIVNTSARNPYSTVDLGCRPLNQVANTLRTHQITRPARSKPIGIIDCFQAQTKIRPNQAKKIISTLDKGCRKSGFALAREELFLRYEGGELAGFWVVGEKFGGSDFEEPAM